MNANITVLIPTHNRAHYLAECLESVLNQTLPPSQVIVINDGSTDETRKTLGPYGSRVEVLETPQRGKSAALNKAIPLVRGDYLWIFDDDDVALPDALSRLVRPLEDDPGAGFSFSTFFFAETEAGGRHIGRVVKESRVPDLAGRGFLVPLLEDNFLSGATLFARSDCYRKVGLFNPDLLRSQDYDMAIRIARTFKGARAPGGPTFYYRQDSELYGHEGDPLTVENKKERWLVYDQMLFRKLYQELPLEVYLPPGVLLEGHERRALLQRLAVMAAKVLVPQMQKDLHELDGGDDRSAFTPPEVEIVRSLLYLREGRAFLSREFLDSLRTWSRQSAVVRRLRAEVARGALARCRERLSAEHIKTAFRILK